MDDVCNKIVVTCETIGNAKIAGIPLESADLRLLDVREGELDDHVAMQPAAIAYFGTLKKAASRQLCECKQDYEMWQKLKYAEAKQNVDSGSKKPTVADIEAQYVRDNEVEIRKWRSKISDTQAQCDTLDVWYEAWKQKSFTLHSHANITMDEYMTTDHIKSEGNVSRHQKYVSKKDAVRGIMRKGKSQ